MSRPASRPISQEATLHTITGLVLGLLTLLDAAFWVRIGSSYWLWNVPGIILAIIVIVCFVRGEHIVAASIIFPILALAGWMLGAVTSQLSVPAAPAGLLTVHTIWVFGFAATLIVDKVRSTQIASRGDGPSPRQAARQQKADQKAARQAELEYAAKIERQQKWVEKASRPGYMTGYEPAALANVTFERPPYMYGDPGVGLLGSGFDQRSVDRGREGEVNFAKSLAKAGLIGRFATFWSVQTPAADGPGIDPQFPTDIDCVLITGNTVWLLDMKNYAQGDVTWKSEMSTDERGKPIQIVVAIDNVTGGQVGEDRHVSQQMKLARERFQKRFAASGVKYRINAAVVMMPRPEGLGLIPQEVKWPGDIQAAGLPHVLDWLAREPSFNPATDDAVFVTRVLNTLIKDESGSAPQLGKRPKHQNTTAAPATAAQTTQYAASPSPSVAAPVPEPPAPPAAKKNCKECGAEMDADQEFCYACGAAA